MNTKSWQIFQLRQEAELLWHCHLAELEVNAQDRAEEYLREMYLLQSQINQLIADENLESS